MMLRSLAVAVRLTMTAASAQVVRIMPVTPTAFPIGSPAPTQFAATSGHLYCNVYDLSGDLTGAKVLWKGVVGIHRAN